MNEPSSSKIRVGAAVRAMRALLKDPDDTAQVFRIIEALSGKHGERMLAKLKRTEEGARLLAERPNLAARLADHSALSKLPEGTLGREYLAFLEREGITAEGLVKASLEGTTLFGCQELEYVRDRMRDSHDLWHVLTGYRGDLIGEAALLAFSFAQTKNPGVGFIIGVAFLRGRESTVRSMMARGYARGARARFLAGVYWEELLDCRVDEVRRLLGVEPTEPYEDVRAATYKAAMAA